MNASEQFLKGNYIWGKEENGNKGIKSIVF